MPEGGDVVAGQGWAVGHLDALGDGPDFRKVRRALGVTAFGVNALVLPPGYTPPCAASATCPTRSPRSSS